jgi:hypothetical protein
VEQVHTLFVMNQKGIMKNSLLILMFFVGLSFQAFGQTPATGFEVRGTVRLRRAGKSFALS